MLFFYKMQKGFTLKSAGAVLEEFCNRMMGRFKMWYLIFFLLGAVVGSLLTFLRYETKCRDCGVRANCEEFP